MSVHKIRLLELCRKHEVDLRTIEWFALPENALYWETLARKLEEIDRRSTMGDGHFKVKNPSAWLTKFFNTIKKQNGIPPGAPGHTHGPVLAVGQQSLAPHVNPPMASPSSFPAPFFMYGEGDSEES